MWAARIVKLNLKYVKENIVIPNRAVIKAVANNANNKQYLKIILYLLIAYGK